MKWLLWTLGLVAAFIVFVLFAWPKKNSGPEPITFGRETCAHCRMLISRAGFGGELRDSEGTLTKYDDIGCLLLAMFETHREFLEAWVEDHQSGAFVPLLSAIFVKEARTVTPMGYGVLAFKDVESAQTFAQQDGGEVVALEILMKDRERFKEKPSPTKTQREVTP